MRSIAKRPSEVYIAEITYTWDDYPPSVDRYGPFVSRAQAEKRLKESTKYDVRGNKTARIVTGQVSWDDD